MNMTANIRIGRLLMEAHAREAIAWFYSITPSIAVEKKKLKVGEFGPEHEFDIYLEGKVIGGVTTGTYRTSKGRTNTAMRDRAAAELLWLTLWPGDETRVFVVTDRRMADWLVRRFDYAPLAHSVNVFHHDSLRGDLHFIGSLGHVA